MYSVVILKAAAQKKGENLFLNKSLIVESLRAHEDTKDLFTNTEVK